MELNCRCLMTPCEVFRGPLLVLRLPGLPRIFVVAALSIIVYVCLSVFIEIVFLAQLQFICVDKKFFLSMFDAC